MEERINGLAVRCLGDPDRIPVVFIHGFPYSSTMWRNQLEKLRRDYYCVSYDVRGLGESPPGDGQFTMELLVDDLFAILDHLRLDRPVVAGFSMGGYLALRAAEREPGRFRGLILCDTRSEADNDQGKIKRAYWIKAINTRGMKSFAAEFVPLCFAENAAERMPGVFAAALEEAGRQDPLGAKGCLLAMASRTDTTGSLSALDLPVLLLVGERDGLTPPAVMQSMSERIGDSRFEVVPGAGHMTPVENPGAVNRLLEEFLKQRF